MQGKGNRESEESHCEWVCEGTAKKDSGLPEALNPGHVWGSPRWSGCWTWALSTARVRFWRRHSASLSVRVQTGL